MHTHKTTTRLGALYFFSCSLRHHDSFYFFFFNDTATTEIYTLSLHDALPISLTTSGSRKLNPWRAEGWSWMAAPGTASLRDRKSTRLNSSHLVISYAVFCLKKKKNKTHKSIMTNRCQRNEQSTVEPHGTQHAH